MALDPDLASLMTQTVTIKPRTSLDAYSKPGFGAGVNYKARVVAAVKRVRGYDGEEKLSSHEVWLASLSGAKPTDEITLPDGSKPPILLVEKYPDEDGDYYEKIYLGDGQGGKAS